MTSDQKFLVIGCRGQIGKALLKILGDRGVGLDSTQLDLTKTDLIAKTLQEYDSSAIINAAAYTTVDKAETDRQTAHLVNALAPEVIAKFCKEKDIPFVHFSTDYVYSGLGSHFMSEDEKYGPANYYAVSKLEGDQRVQQVGGKFLIFRVCWVYDLEGKNFVNTILRLANEKKELSVINDQFGAPSFAGDLAQATIDCLYQAINALTFPAGIYNLSSSGITNWQEYAQTIVTKAKTLGADLKTEKVLPITTADYVTPAKRPMNSRLDTEKVKRVFGIELPSWQDSLERVLKEKYAGNESRN
jgi:dTDP-4-dehydrorhamnose reductase